MVGEHISKYRVTEQIGRGGMGTVYRAIDETLHREVAIKVLNAELNDPSVARRFRAEAVTVARLNHPGIATIYELVQHEGQWLMVMEFVRGETLEHLCVRRGALPVEQAADVCMQTLAALAHAHGLGVVHRDLKPANIMVTDNGAVKVMDFGIARVTGSEHLTSAGFMMGTPAYMAPEQVMGHEIDARTDLYATGVVLYYLASGRLPFKGDTPMEMAQSRIRDEPTPLRSVRDDLPAWLGQVLDIALARDPERRFQTALLFREALRRGLAHLPIDTPGPAPTPPELIATAAPRSMPILSGASDPVAIEIPRSTPPPASDMPTVATSMPAASIPPPAAASGRGALIAGAFAVLLVVVAASVFLKTRGAAPALPARDIVDAPSTAPSPTLPSTEPAPTLPLPSQPLSSTVNATPLTGGNGAATPGPGAAAPAVGTVAATRSGVPPADGRATSPGTAAPTTTSRADAARGRGRGVAASPMADSPITFPDLRAFVVNGKKAEEQDAAL
ncbi:MAG: protein kinase, partial [Acidobacteriota bacterium]